MGEGVASERQALALIRSGIGRRITCSSDVLRSQRGLLRPRRLGGPRAALVVEGALFFFTGSCLSAWLWVQEWALGTPTCLPTNLLFACQPICRLWTSYVPRRHRRSRSTMTSTRPG